jgi:hypothetical protein
VRTQAGGAFARERAFEAATVEDLGERIAQKKRQKSLLRGGHGAGRAEGAVDQSGIRVVGT